MRITMKFNEFAILFIYTMFTTSILAMAIVATRLSANDEELNYRLMAALDKNYLFNILFNVVFNNNMNNNWFRLSILTGFIYILSGTYICTQLPIPVAEMATVITAHIPLSISAISISLYNRYQ